MVNAALTMSVSLSQASLVNAALTLFEGKPHASLHLCSLPPRSPPRPLPAPASAAQITAVTSVNVVKPVALAKLQDMDFGTLTFAGFTGTRTIVLSRPARSPAPPTSSAAAPPSRRGSTSQGTNKLTVLLTYSGGTLSNGTDSIPFTANGPAIDHADQFGRAGDRLRRRRLADDQPDAGRRRL